MPELPEAETIARTLAPHLAGARITSVEWLAPRATRGGRPTLEGRRIVSVRRHGKQILFEMDQGFLVVKLGMTGSLRVNAGPGPYTRAVFRLDRGVLHFDDVRQFGWIEWRQEPPPNLGPDPLEITAADLAALV
ncbi:MAG: DNA-formamidopyrimidine glycosylase family protein, partial [Bryobacteraceae bacterium]